MGSIYIAKGQISSVAGYSRHVVFSDELNALGAREFPGEKNLLPRNLPGIEYFAMQCFPPPLEAVQSTGDQSEQIALATTAFGSGGSGSWSETELVPTSARWERCRAWVLRKRCEQGGGDKWFGSRIQHNNAVAAAWLDVNVVRDWAKGLFSTAFGRLLIEQAAKPLRHGELRLQPGEEFPADPNLRVCSTKYYATKEEGVRAEHSVEWGRWHGQIVQALPGAWIATTTYCHGVTEWLSLPGTVYRNGSQTELRLHEVEESGEPTLALSLPTTQAPVNVTGDFAAVFASEEAMVAFCVRKNVFAEKLYLGLYSPRDKEAGAHILRMTEEWANIAWSEGATPAPETIGEIPPLSGWGSDRGGMDGGKIQIGSLFAHGRVSAKRVSTVFMSDGYNGTRHRGWAKVPHDVNAEISYGLSVRDPGDDVAERHETVIFTDGRVKLPAP